jgi:alanine-synthesizing transaminase
MAPALGVFIHNFYRIEPTMVELASLTQHYELPPNRLYRLREALLKKGEKIIDLVSGSVHAQGIFFPDAVLKHSIQEALRKAKVYRPDPAGLFAARQSISRTYAQEDVDIPPEQILLTPGTSISYWYAFKVLADPGDEILAPTPSYPLFESIAQLSGIKLIPYPLRERTRWEIDFGQLESSITARTKAIILISPHNPTGAVATDAELQQLSVIASRRGLPIISDEVFSPFLFSCDRLPRPALHPMPLVFTLNGFSKMLALPAMKIGWMAVTGNSALVFKTMKALEMISDTFLPVNEVAQAAVTPLLGDSKAFQRTYTKEINRRMEFATAFLKGLPGASFIRPEGGFYLTLSLQKPEADEEAMCCQILEKHKILVHPGYFYDMEGRHVVLSFVSRPVVLRRALSAIAGEFR